jgi:Uncharacterized protein conserved in bacteria
MSFKLFKKSIFAPVKIFPAIFSVLMLVVTVFTASILTKNKDKPQRVENYETLNDAHEALSENIDTPKNNEPQSENKELRAVWVPFMDLCIKNFSEENFKNHYKEILDKAEKLKLNTVFVQVRPFSDALYPSVIFPWSHILTGEQGKNPGFDPLKFMLEETHAKGIKFHAWVAPMRIRLAHFPKDLSETNPCVKWERDNPDKFKKYVVKSKEYEYYDPQYEEVRKLIADGVKEIVEKYDVDGINFDDYFYPANNLWVDGKQTVSAEPDTDLEKRKENINLLISEVYSAVKSVKKDVSFGVCPQGNFDNLQRGGVDIDTWIKSEGYVDYLCPEIYTNSENPVLPFEKAVSDWKNRCTNKKIKLYVGLGLYKTGTTEYDKGSWIKSDDIIKNQIEYAREKGYDGFSLYSSVYLSRAENHNEVQNIMKVLS